MAKLEVDGCVSCGLPCLGDSCSKRHEIEYTCDDCGDSFQPDELYVYEDEMFCEKCLLDKFRTVAQEEGL